METIVLLALGEKLTTLGGSTGLGSNLAEVQSQEFQDLVTYDCKRISNAFSRCLVTKVVNRLFPGQERLCRFEFIEDDNVQPEQYLSMAKQVRDLGLAIDVQKLREVTGLTFIGEEQKDLWTPERTEEDKDE